MCRLAPEHLDIYGPPGTADLLAAALIAGLKTLASSGSSGTVTITEWVLDVEDGLNLTPVPGTNDLVKMRRRPPDQYSPRWTGRTETRVRTSISEVFLANISPKSPRKLFIFIMYKNIFRIKVSQQIFNILSKKTSLTCIPFSTVLPILLTDLYSLLIAGAGDR